MSGLARRIGLFDATMVVMGGIVGSGIFVTPAIVARNVHSTSAMLAVWLVGGAAAIIGAFIYAELSAARPQVGGQYAYLREAYHPAAAFLYGWALLLVIQTGGMAANAITFARHFVPLPIGENATAALAVAALTVVNCLGVRAGASVQSALMVLKILALALLVGFGLFAAGPLAAPASHAPDSFGAALVPVLFSYGGWQTACFVAAEMKEPSRDLPRALVIGVAAVIVLYVSVAFVCARALGPEGLAQSAAPALDVMTRVVGSRGAQLIGAGIALSTLGFLSQSILTAPRVYFAMAEDGLFFRRAAGVHPRTHAPVAAIALQGALTIVITLAGTFELILNYVTSIDFIFFALTAGCVFIFRRRGATGRAIPGHPVTTLAFIAICGAVVFSTFREHPLQGLIGLGITLAGLPVYFLWRRS
jgi:APA family basic amino acid/polyamine antiporter